MISIYISYYFNSIIVPNYFFFHLKLKYLSSSSMRLYENPQNSAFILKVHFRLTAISIEQIYFFASNLPSWSLETQLFKSSLPVQMFLQSKLKEKMNTPLDAFWIGLMDSQTEGRWFWVDGSPLDPSLRFWYKGEPNNSAGTNPAGEDCVMMVKTENIKDLNNWVDHSCHVQIKSVCEKPAEM
uniref:C-type lectin domain-containing protein n=1 Tax=Xiphophorus maculatus TaxID=8083 RepID=A0A3B5PPE2_XIPMA